MARSVLIWKSRGSHLLEFVILLLSIGAVTTIDGGQRSVAKGGRGGEGGTDSDITDAGNRADGRGEKMSPKGTDIFYTAKARSEINLQSLQQLTEEHIFQVHM